MARNATFRGANLQYVAAPKSLTGLSDVTVASAANLDRLQYSTSAGKWVDVAALTTPQIEDSSADHQYIVAVSELAADRTITLPLLTGNDTFVFASFAATLANKTLTSAVLNTGVSGSAVLDQDDMSGNSATQLATQQSIKAYVDAQVATEDTLSELNDTTISGPASNDVLQYSGSAWVDRTYAEAGLASLTGSETLTNKTLTAPILNGGALTALTDLDMTSGNKTILDTIGSNTLTVGASGTTVSIPGSLTVTGGQIAFPSTQAASAGANTLDDYEEGTFTPAIGDANLDGSGEGQAYDTQVGRYQKIGNRVYYHCRVGISDLGTLATSQAAALVGLPFTANATSGSNAAITVGYGASLNITAGHSIGGFVSPNSTYINLYVWDDAAGTTGLEISELSAGGDIMISGHYEV